MPVAPMPIAPAARPLSILRGFGLAALCGAGALIGMVVFGVIVSILAHIQTSQPALFSVAVFAALLTICLRLAFHGGGRG